ncbi:MCE family protein [Nocardia panacis]|uniref:MCE family protein n=1 Tax=Nocardia panacis TaxID=2340916 RepID=A0A3A4KN07_9NOCA|nr:MCE family protein [Nocardia panacis]RJO76948.1 MCE family protein [Nocardia panacis]
MTRLRARFNSNRHFWVGILGAALVLVLVLISSAYKLIGVGQQHVDAEFVQAAGIKVGDKVNVAGIMVGQVAAAKLEGSHVLLTLNVNSEVRFGADAKASIKMATLLGARFVDVEPGDGSGLKGNRIPLSNTTVPYNLADVVQEGTPKFAQLDTKKLAESLNLINKQMGDSPALVAQALDSVGALAKVIDNRKAQVDGLLKDLDRVTKILGDNRNSVLLVITQGEAIANRVMQRQTLLRELLDNIARLSRELQQIGDQNGGQFGPTIDQLNTMAEGLQKNKDNLDRLLSIMPPTVRYLSNAYGGNGPYGTVGLPWLFPDNWLCFANVIEGCQG